jgi:hypothetical protein
MFSDKHKPLGATTVAEKSEAAIRRSTLMCLLELNFYCSFSLILRFYYRLSHKQENIVSQYGYLTQ